MHNGLAWIARAALAGWAACGLPASATSPVEAAEYRHTATGRHFLTASPAEQVALDAGEVWRRTAHAFRVYASAAPGLVPVCRFFSDAFGSTGVHFYTAAAEECAWLRTVAAWTPEGDAFHVQPVAMDGGCPAGHGPVYRLYEPAGGAPRHRWTPWRSERAKLVARGWIPEGRGDDGVAFCVPVANAAGLALLLPLAERKWLFQYAQNANTRQFATVVFGPLSVARDAERQYEVGSVDSHTIAFVDPFIERVVVFLAAFPMVRFVVDAFTPDELQGCAYEQVDWSYEAPRPAFEEASYGPCMRFSAAPI